MAMRMREYAVHAEYAHIRKYANADENPQYPQDKSGKSSSQRSILILGAASISIDGGNMKIGGGPYLCISVCQSKEVFGVRGCIRIWNSAGMPWKRFWTGF